MSYFRINPQFGFNFEGLLVDNFAGGGGASTGIEAALGRAVDIAVNHDEKAISLHTVNHPKTQHYCESVWDIDPRQVCAGHPVDLAWFSPDCRHFSKAKGGTPVSARVRGLAWVVMRWIGTVRPKLIFLENVEEFRTWGPLVKDGSGDYRPCKKRQGRTFNSFINAIRKHGYEVETKELRARAYGAATIRKRLFLVARCDGQPIRWPEPSHGPGLLPYDTTANHVDWSEQVPSILGRKKILADNTMKRIALGLERFVLNHPDPFVAPLNEQQAENYITRMEHAVVEEQQKANGIREPLKRTRIKTENSVVMAHVIKHFGGMVGTSIEEPLPTTTTRGTQNQIQASYMVKLRNNQTAQDLREPAPTFTSGGGHVANVTAFLVKYYGTTIAQTIEQPLQTNSTENLFGFAIVEKDQLSLTDDQLYSAWWVARLQEEFGSNNEVRVTQIPVPRPSMILAHGYIVVEIGMRMFLPRELYSCQGFSSDYVIDRDSQGNPITKTQQNAKCGNSVSPLVAEALVRVNTETALEIVDVA